MTYIDPYDGETENGCCRCECNRSAPVARIHTPERVEACLVEGRFGVPDLDVATAAFDRTYQRRGDAWVDEVIIDGRPWLRAAVWCSPPDKVHVEASSREAYEQMAELILALPTTVKKRSKREHDDHYRDRYWGYGQQRLHRSDALAGRPTPGPAEALEGLHAEYERRWLQRPHALLDGMSPEEAAKDDEALFKLYDLLELAQVRGRDRVGLAPGTDLNRVREALDIGQRW